MDILSSKSILIAVGILISIMIVTGVILTVNKAREIYGLVDKTDISVVKEFEDILSTYNGMKMNGVGLINTIKRFEGNKIITIEYPEFLAARAAATAKVPAEREAVYLNDLMKLGNNAVYTYEKTYTVSADYFDNNSKIKIIFK